MIKSILFAVLLLSKYAHARLGYRELSTDTDTFVDCGIPDSECTRIKVEAESYVSKSNAVNKSQNEVGYLNAIKDASSMSYQVDFEPGNEIIGIEMTYANDAEKTKIGVLEMYIADPKPEGSCEFIVISGDGNGLFVKGNLIASITPSDTGGYAIFETKPMTTNVDARMSTTNGGTKCIKIVAREDDDESNNKKIIHRLDSFEFIIYNEKSNMPSKALSNVPSKVSSKVPSSIPSESPTLSTVPSSIPSNAQSAVPSNIPSESKSPTQDCSSYDHVTSLLAKLHYTFDYTNTTSTRGVWSTLFLDSSESNNNGIVHLETRPTFTNTDDGAKFNNAWKLNNAGDYVTMGAPFRPRPCVPWTIAFYSRFYNSSVSLFSSTSKTDDYRLWMRSESEKISVTLQINGDTIVWDTDESDGMKHYALVADMNGIGGGNNIVALYIDGEQVGPTSSTTDHFSTDVTMDTFGSYECLTSEDDCSGVLVDELWILEEALDECQVDGLRNKNIIKKCN